MQRERLLRRLLLAVAVATGVTGCAVAQKTDLPLLRKDVRTDAQQAIADMNVDHGDLHVTASVDRDDKTYDPGQPITLRVQTSKDAHVAILEVLANGETTIVFPNRPHHDSAVKANTVLTVPAADDPVKIAVDKPGTVLFEFIASTASDAWLFTRPPDNGSDFADLGGTTRNIARDAIAALKVGAGHDTAAAHVTVRIAGGSLF